MRNLILQTKNKKINPRLKAFNPSQNDNPELFQYYYHSDHLGSSSLITNLDGEIVQHIEYVPFGEVFIEERNNRWNTPYLFNAKELDEETGLYYYGARYYDPRTSVWLSTDPLQEKYPNISSYAYCFQNPVKFIDPTGMEGEDPEEGWVHTKDNSMVYDSRVIDQKTATKHYGKSATFIPVGSSYTTAEGDKVELGQYGFYKLNGDVKLLKDIGPQKIAEAKPVDYSGATMTAGILMCGVLIADDATFIGVADDPAIPVVFTVAAVSAIVMKATYEIEKIRWRPDPGPDGVQYSLRATVTGPYPNVRGGTTILSVGDVWKFGETTSPEHRYTQTYLNTMNLNRVDEFFGNQRAIKIAEKSKIYGYFLIHGNLPPGNRIFR